jgi:hypothetical protein
VRLAARASVARRPRTNSSLAFRDRAGSCGTIGAAAAQETRLPKERLEPNEANLVCHQWCLWTD